MSSKLKSRAVGLLALLAASLTACNRSPVTSSITEFPNVSKPLRVSPNDAEAAEPAIASGPDGSVYAVWVNHTPNAQADVMVARFDGNGAMQGAPVRVNHQPGIVTAWRGDPPTIAVASDNTIFVGWTGRVDSDSGHATNIYLSSSRDEGRAFSDAVKVNDDSKPAVHGMHSIAISNDGRIYMAWLDERNVAPMEMKETKTDASSGHHMESNRELFVASSVDGGHTFSANQRVASDVCPCCKTALASARDGRLYLSWRQVLPGDFRHIAIASSTDAAKTFSKPVIVSDDQWILKGCPVSGASLVAEENGSVRVLWYAGGEKGQHGVYWAESRDGGQTFSPRQMVAATNALGTPVLLNSAGGRNVAVWESNEKGAARLRAAAVPGSKERIEQYEIGEGELPAVAASPEKLFAVYLSKDNNRQAV